jgi:hypothetical protein
MTEDARIGLEACTSREYSPDVGPSSGLPTETPYQEDLMKLSTANVLFPLVFVLATATAFAQNNTCSSSAQQMLNSCQLGAQSDYSLALSKCENESDPGKRDACRQQARAALQDALASCNAQFPAREKICGFLGGRGWDPEIKPSDFSTFINNPYFPLKPGTTFVYQARTADGLKENRVAVTHKTKTILGVVCVEVHDTVRVNGQLTEDTLDWYAQDKAENVWYFGEDSEELTGGRVSNLGGSWTAGVDGAEPGIIMEAHPKVGDPYRQELLLDEAEDFARVISLEEDLKVPFGAFNDCLKTEETSGVEPDALEFKFYAPGIGVVFVNDITGNEKDFLVNIIAE